MQSKIFDSWYNKDLAHDADRESNYFTIAGCFTFFLVLLGLYWAYARPWLYPWKYRDDRMRYCYMTGPQPMNMPTPMRQGVFQRAARWGSRILRFRAFCMQ